MQSSRSHNENAAEQSSAPSRPRLTFRSLSAVGSSSSSSPSPALGRHVKRSISASARFPRQNSMAREVVLNDVVGNGISGILHKWVNYGRGWRPRWFELHDGVLSYYKIHGNDKLVLNGELENDSKVIGVDSLRRINTHRHCPSRHRKPVSEMHLMVCSVKENKNDERRFSISTGTKKRLHLRAESRDDREVWVQAIMAVKEMYPRLSNKEIMAPVASVADSTSKLRQRLLQEGVSEAAIRDCEDIMGAEVLYLRKQIVALKHKQLMLMDTLRHLETEKVDLENTLVDDIKSKDNDPSYHSSHEKYSDGSVSDSSDEHDRHEDQFDDEHNDAFFDTQDFLSISHDSEEEEQDEDYDENTPNESEKSSRRLSCVGLFKYPQVKRRTKLPEPVEKESGVSLWSIIKENIGKDLTKVCLPVYFNEPLSSLQKCCEDMEYSYLLDRASEWGKMGDSLMRALHVAAFAVSGYASTSGRSCKPFNPLLGETYEADFPDKGFRFISEKVSHHPMTVACHCDGNGWKFWGDSTLKSKFWGRSIQLDPIGILTLEFDDGEIFQWSKVTTSIYNLILGKLYCDHYGTMRIEGNRDFSCKIKFKEQSIIDKNPHQVQGVIEDKYGETMANIFGKWDESLVYVIGGNSNNKKKGGKGSNSSKPILIWKTNPPPEHQTKYNLTQFAITLNEITPRLQEKLPPTDSRLRPDQRYLENGEHDMANSEKLRLEQRQREARKLQERGWKPKWFVKENGSESYSYNGGYWEAREIGNWESCPDIFGQILNTSESNSPTT
ncbi:hypothetical protein HN51_020568 [Arachis hypogaea]|uniref:PH domain-containing protein n=1 Tax=Arachis hypogaea TaxID=3818 RepID=A0A445C1F3_ARAHY|nr:oxysterol-binding protein-related protein 1B [Arachis hypogaea]QHO32545.1 Oxysterol-binding protein-related protein 1C [Arachis hypogaea]RYR44748.1 hypothetical protein Ahy_A08g041033 [Arachis hypogaea]